MVLFRSSVTTTYDSTTISSVPFLEGQGSPLHYAAMINNIEATEYLLQNGASYDDSVDSNWSIAMCPCEVRWEDWEYERAFAYLPLHTAACHGNLDVARVLLEHGASVHFQCAQRNYLGYPYERHHPPMTFRYVDSEKPLLHSIVHKGSNRLAMIDLIARHPGADINERDDNMMTPLGEAVRELNNGDIIAKLVQLGEEDPFDPPYNHLGGCLARRDLENALALLEAGVYSYDHMQPVVDRHFCALVNPLARMRGWKTTADNEPLDLWGETVVRAMPEELITRIVRIMAEKYDLDINTTLHESSHTPLNFIIHIGNRTKLKFLVTLLINLGARLDIADQLGHNALVACLWVRSKSRKCTDLRHTYNDILPLLIKASWRNDVDMNAKYTWKGKRQKLFKILRKQFPMWQPAKGLPTGVLWRSLYASLFDFDEGDSFAAAYV